MFNDNPTPLQIQEEHLQELKLIAEEIGATRTQVIDSRIRNGNHW